MAESSQGEYGEIFTCSRGEYEKILASRGNGCIVTRVRVYNEILPEPSGNPSGNISFYTPPLVTIQLQYNYNHIILPFLVSFELVHYDRTVYVHCQSVLATQC